MQAVVVSGEGIVGVQNHANNTRNPNFAGATGDFLYDVAVTPGRAVLVSGGFDSKLRIWNGSAANSQPVRVIEPPVEIDAAIAETNTANQQAAAN